MSEVPLIHTCWLKPFAEFFDARGVSLKPYCELHQVPHQAVTSGNRWITKHQLYGLLHEIAVGEDLPELGFLVGESLTPDCLGDLGLAMAAEKTLGGVLRTFGDLLNRHVEGNRCWLEEGEPGKVWLFNEKGPSEEPGRIIADQAGLMSMINLVRLIAGDDWYPSRACLQTPSITDVRKLPGIGAMKLKFGASATGFPFPVQWLLRPTRSIEAVSSTDPETPGLIAEGEPIGSKLELLLADILGVGGICPTARLMAELCDVSERSLHRQLKADGKSYKSILDSVRHQRACELLHDGKLTIKEVAFCVGYSHPNNFVRAFKRLHGSTPASYRKSFAANGSV